MRSAIIEQAADELAQHRRPPSPDIAVRLPTGAMPAALFEPRCFSSASNARIGRPPASPRLPPIGGALLAAAQLLDWPIDDGWIGQLAATVEGGDRAVPVN